VVRLAQHLAESQAGVAGPSHIRRDTKVDILMTHTEPVFYRADPQTTDEIETLLGAAERRGLTKGVEAIRRALAFTSDVVDLVKIAGEPEPPGPGKRPQVPAQRTESPAPSKETNGHTPTRSVAHSGPGMPPAPSGRASCGHSDPLKGPCQREPHDPENTRHRYAKAATVTRLASVNPNEAFMDKMVKGSGSKPIYDQADHALIVGSNVVFSGSSSQDADRGLEPGWVGKVVEIDREHHMVLAYGKHPKQRGPAAEHLIDTNKLRWVPVKDAQRMAG
jgi:hypothetical protein